MSLLTDIQATVDKAIAMRMHPVSITVSRRGLIQIAEALRRSDTERREFRISVIDGAPHVWSPFEKKYVPIKPKAFFYDDGKFKLEIPFVESPIMLDDKFIVEYTNDPLPRKPQKDPEAWKHASEPQDTGRIE